MNLALGIRLWIVAALGFPSLLFALPAQSPPSTAAEAAFQQGLLSLSASPTNSISAAQRQAQARRYFKIGAELGHPAAMFNYALALSHPTDTNAPDWTEIALWYERAASNQVTEAAYNRALIFLQPPAGQKEDPAAALRWLDQAATNGFAPAQAILGRMFSQAQGVERNDVLASFWLRSAAQQGNPDALLALSRLIVAGRAPATPGEDPQALLRTAAQGGVTEAQELLARSYQEEKGPEAKIQATRWYREAAQQGSALAQWQLGLRLRQGEGVATNEIEGTAWMLLASDRVNREVLQDLRDLEASLPTAVWQEIRQRADSLRQEVATRLIKSRLTPSEPKASGPPLASPSPARATSGKTRPRRLSDVFAPSDDDRPGLPPESYRKALSETILHHFQELVRVEAKNSLAAPDFSRGHATVTYRLHADGRLTDIHFEAGSTGGAFQILLSEALAKTSPYIRWTDAIRRLVGNDYVDLVYTCASGEEAQ